MGYVAPTLLVLRKLLVQSEKLTYCKPLSLTIINSLDKRFNFIYDLGHSKSKSFILASISHPKFKMGWVPIRYNNLCKKIFVNECNLMSTVIITHSDSSDESMSV